MLSSRPHLDVGDWLEKLDLKSYHPVFQKYAGVEDMLHLSEKDLKAMGIKNGSHRARIATSLHVLKDKYQKAYKSHSPNASMSSLRADNANFKSFESVSPLSHLHLDGCSSGVRSWPSSGTSSLAHTRHSSHRSSMEGSIGTDATAEELKKALERELSLDGSDLRSYAWYHGTILRQRAEELVVREGDFLVRDCISQPGDFVITCRWRGLPLHFIVKKVVLHPDTVYEKIQYSFERDSFDSIADFVTYYVGGRHPLSDSSGVVISNPINRSMPLTYYASRYGVQCQIHYAAKALEKVPAERTCSGDPPKPELPTSPKPVGNAVIRTVNDTGMSASDHGESEKFEKQSGSEPEPAVQRKKLVKVGSDPNLNPNAERKMLENRPNSGSFTIEAVREISSRVGGDQAPPKPSRVPSRRLAQKPLVVKRERRSTPPTPLQDLFVSDQSGSSVPHSLPLPVKRMISGETRFSFLDRPSVSSEGSVPDVDSVDSTFTVPSVPGVTCYSPCEFRSPLISTNNKPLEGNVLNKVRELVLSEPSRHLACHLTRIDLEVAKNFGDEDLGLGVMSGLELILLPQGQQLVRDLLERTNCLKVFVEVTLLTSSSEDERVQLLCKWIEIAVDIKNALGNFFGFTAIMLGLTSPEVLCLNSTWLQLRQVHTEIAFAFETKLRPAFKAMQEANMQAAPNTCIPYILSLLHILEHHLQVMQGSLPDDESTFREIPEKKFSFDVPGETNSKDYGIQILVDHLQVGRSLFLQVPVFHSNSEMTLKNVKYDNLLLDIFRTEFHLRVLWGWRGAVVDSEERHAKFEKVLQVLCKRCQVS